MCKKVATMAVAIMICLVFAGIGSAGNPRGKTGAAGGSNTAHLYLYEKDYNDPAWPVIEDGAWGKMRYFMSGSDFDLVFNGHGLEPDMEYALIYYPDPWPGDGLICLGTGIADFEGDVHIKGIVDTGDLPSMFDENPGAKIWLVLAADVDCMGQSMIGWNPGEYLFEYELITFDDIDL